ncbi:MAG: Rossmann-like domain-containing protein [Chloroflexota bacterium]
MNLLKTLLDHLPSGKVISVDVGLFWTVVVVETATGIRCGLAATLHNPELEHADAPAVRQAGHLEKLTARQLAEGVSSSSWLEVSIGLAAINALLPPPPKTEKLAAEDYIARQGAHSRVALIGHFPFVERLRQQVAELWVLELNPRPGDLPATQAEQVIPQADILAITATTLINGTFDRLFALRRPASKVLLLGPSTPLSPLLFDHGIHVLSGVIVKDIEAVRDLARQGATFRQIKKGGVELVTLEAPVGQG